MRANAPITLRKMLVVVACALTAAAAPAAGQAQAPARPDLLVPTGSVQAAGGQLAGSFVIRNKGRLRARRSSAALVVRVSGKSRVLKRFPVRALRRSSSLKVKVSVALPGDLPAGSLPLSVCADNSKKIRERTERNNCRGVGTLILAGPGAGTPAGPVSSVPTDPIAFTEDTVFTLNSTQSNYWIYVPAVYDEAHATPIVLFVWLHGCGGTSASDIYTVAPYGGQSYIAITVGGREGGCWDMGADPAKVLAAIANVKTHFNINPRQVIVGGYSSGGDLSYRTAFYNANTFAGVLAENTSPFMDTCPDPAACMSAAAWKFNVVHLAHTEDATYPIGVVRSETDAMAAAGFPITRIERPGSHYDPDVGATGTDYDLQTLLLPHLADGWLSP